MNESYYRTVLRFVLLYRECLNEYGWLKRRDHYHKAYYELSQSQSNKVVVVQHKEEGEEGGDD